MSKYQSVSTAIQLVEAAANIVGNGLIAEGKTGELIRDLRDIAKDVRYGGEWDGDYETVATALGYCAEQGFNCSICPYRKEMACRQRLKRDAMHAIRAMGARLKKYEEGATRKNVVKFGQEVNGE